MPEYSFFFFFKRARWHDNRWADVQTACPRSILRVWLPFKGARCGMEIRAKLCNRSAVLWVRWFYTSKARRSCVHIVLTTGTAGHRARASPWRVTGWLSAVCPPLTPVEHVWMAAHNRITHPVQRHQTETLTKRTFRGELNNYSEQKNSVIFTNAHNDI